MSIVLLSWLATPAHAVETTYTFTGLKRCLTQMIPCIDIRDTDAEILPGDWLREVDDELGGLRSLFVTLTVEQSDVQLLVNGVYLSPSDAVVGRDGSLTWQIPAARGDTLEFETANAGGDLALYHLSASASRISVD